LYRNTNVVGTLDDLKPQGGTQVEFETLTGHTDGM